MHLGTPDGASKPQNGLLPANGFELPFVNRGIRSTLQLQVRSTLHTRSVPMN
jgi:hypothetical protein